MSLPSTYLIKSYEVNIIFYKIFMEQQNMQQCSHLYMNKTEFRDMVPQNIHLNSDSPPLFLL